MRYQIDQSGKVEDTRKLTIVAFANGKVKSLKISAVEKRKLVKAMRELDYPKKTFIYKIFAGLIFLLIRDEQAQELVIDKEYPGHEDTIKNVLLHLFRKENKDAPNITFGLIGKKSAAHEAALAVFQNRVRPTIEADASDVIQLLYA